VSASKAPEVTTSSRQLNTTRKSEEPVQSAVKAIEETPAEAEVQEVPKEAGLVATQEREEALPGGQVPTALWLPAGHAKPNLAGAGVGTSPPLEPAGPLEKVQNGALRLDSDKASKIFQSVRSSSMPSNIPTEGEELLTDFKKYYKVGKTLGKGAFSIVKVVTNRDTEEKFAVKIMKTGMGGKADLADVLRELNVLREVKHDNIMNYVAAFGEEDKIYVVTELLKGGELMDYLMDKGTYTEEEAQICFKQLLAALEYIHNKGIIHRDLKLENMLMREQGDVGTVKLADFGMAKFVSQPETQKAIIGTPLYLAPEILNEIESNINPYDTAGDMWSAGVILHILLAGFPPFYAETQPALFAMIREGAYTFQDPVWEGVSDSAKDLISKLLAVDPSKRLSASEAIRHCWCTEPVQQSDLTTACSNMKMMVRRKLKKSVRSVLAMHRMAKLGIGIPKPAAAPGSDEDEVEDEEKQKQEEKEEDFPAKKPTRRARLAETPEGMELPANPTPRQEQDMRGSLGFVSLSELP